MEADAEAVVLAAGEAESDPVVLDVVGAVASDFLGKVKVEVVAIAKEEAAAAPAPAFYVAVPENAGRAVQDVENWNPSNHFWKQKLQICRTLHSSAMWSQGIRPWIEIAPPMKGDSNHHWYLHHMLFPIHLHVLRSHWIEKPSFVPLRHHH